MEKLSSLPPFTNPSFVEGRDHVLEYVSNNSDSETVSGSDAELGAYLDFLAVVARDGILGRIGRNSSMQRQIETRVVDPNDVPEDYFDEQRRMARDRGDGGKVATPEDRHNMVEALRVDQRVGLERWADALRVTYTGTAYPSWFKVYTWSSLADLGRYDQESGRFQDRNDDPTAPYPELSHEALANVYDILHRTRVDGESPDAVSDDPMLQELLVAGDFGDLYAFALQTARPDSGGSIEGEWRRIVATEESVRQLQGHGTGWDIITFPGLRRQEGSTDVFFERMPDGEDVPILATSQSGYGSVRVRGTGSDDLIELRQESLLREHLGEDYDNYHTKETIVRHLAWIDRRDPADGLSVEDLEFLYIDPNTSQYYSTDPRLSELYERRLATDGPALEVLMQEKVRQQLDTAFAAYESVCGQLAGSESGVSPERFRELFSNQAKEWRRQGVYDFLLTELRDLKDGQYRLVATPHFSEAVPLDRIQDLGDGITDQLGLPPIMRGSNYTEEIRDRLQESFSETLRIPPNQQEVSFSLVRSSRDRVRHDGRGARPNSPEEYLQTLRDLQSKPGHSQINHRAIGILESLLYINTVLEADGDYKGPNMISHFEVPPVSYDGEQEGVLATYGGTLGVLPSRGAHSGLLVVG